MERPRKNAGSALVYVIAGVAVASLAVAGYLQLTNAGRARSTRDLGAAVGEMDLEERILEIKRAVEKQAIKSGAVSLPAADAAAAAGVGEAFRLQKADGTTDELSLPAFAPSTSEQAYVGLDHPGDPFSGARATVQSLQLQAEDSGEVATATTRVQTKRVEESPQIDVRQIPVSQFTFFAANGANRLSAQDFGGDLGRVYSRGDLVVDGAPDSSYPLLSGGRLRLTDGARLLSGASTETGGDAVNVPAGFDSADPQFPAEARTELGSRVVTPQSLPLNADLAPSAYATPDANGGTTINLEAFAGRCQVTVHIRRVTVAKPKDGHTSPFQVEMVGAPERLSHRESKAVQCADRDGTTVVALDFRSLHAGPDPLALFVRVEGAAGVDPNAQVLIRGADRLEGDLSIVSPHPLVLSGDFNAVPVNNVTPAASLITSREVRAETVAEAAWAQTAFGSP